MSLKRHSTRSASSAGISGSAPDGEHFQLAVLRLNIQPARARAEGDTVTLAVGIDAYRERRATVARVAASAKNEPITATMKSAHNA